MGLSNDYTTQWVKFSINNGVLKSRIELLFVLYIYEKRKQV
jgi:hypothetical protein